MSSTQQVNALRMPLICLLEELAGVIDGLDDQQYTRKLPQVFNSCIANHVRHELDHVHAWLDALSTGELNYDRRERGTRIESDRRFAIDQVHQLIDQLRRLPDDCAVDRPITIDAMLRDDAPPIRTVTTAAREAAFVVSHTVHHNALISVMIKTLGATHAPRFGYAPSTLAYIRDQSH